jgi:hypothetical protein
MTDDHKSCQSYKKTCLPEIPDFSCTFAATLSLADNSWNFILKLRFINKYNKYCNEHLYFQFEF